MKPYYFNVRCRWTKKGIKDLSPILPNEITYNFMLKDEEEICFILACYRDTKHLEDFWYVNA
jgi:hypothetical protein